MVKAMDAHMGNLGLISAKAYQSLVLQNKIESKSSNAPEPVPQYKCTCASIQFIHVTAQCKNMFLCYITISVAWSLMVKTTDREVTIFPLSCKDSGQVVHTHVPLNQAV